MKTKFSFLIAFALLTAGIFTFSSCSDDDDDKPDEPKVVAYQGSWKGTIDDKSYVNFTVGNVSDASWVISYDYSLTVVEGGSTSTVSGDLSVSSGIGKISDDQFYISLDDKKDGSEYYIKGSFTSDTQFQGSIKVLGAFGATVIEKDFTATKQ